MVLWCRSVGEGGVTLTSAPVYTKKQVSEATLWMKKGRLEDRPGSLVAASDWPGRFPTWSKAVDTCRHYHQTQSDTSKGWEVGWGWRCGSGWRNGMTDG